MSKFLFSAVVLAAGLFAAPSWAFRGPYGPPCSTGESRDGHVTEFSSLQNTNFIVHLTAGADNHDIGTNIFLPGTNVPGGSTASIFIPKSAGACDAWNQTILPGPGGAPGGGGISKLRIEVYIFILPPGLWVTYNIFDTVANYGSNVLIPDLYETTGGVVDPGVELFSVVNLAAYLVNPPTFTLGETFDIVNGQVASLPG